MSILKFDLKKFLKNYKLNEENVSMIFGAIVIVILGVLIVNYFRGNKPQLIPAQNSEITAGASTYEVKEGDSLWKIAEEELGDGFKWQEIQKENNLTTDVVEIGQTLKIPEISLISENGSIEDDTYTVVKGDSLWEIAVSAYGDGFSWVKIAKENNLTNPDIIHSGNILKLPK